MDETVKASVQQLIHQWIQVRQKELQELIHLTWEENQGRLRPDDKLMQEIMDLAAPPPPEPAFTESSTDTEADLGAGLDLIDAATSQGDVLKRLLESIRPFAERAGLFVVKQGIATLYATRGFESDAPKLGAPVVPPPDLEQVLRGSLPSLSGTGPSYTALLAPLSRFEAADARILPLKLRRKAVALLLVDSGLRQHFDHPNHVRALVHAAEAALATLAGAREEEKTGAHPAPSAPSPATTPIPIPAAMPAPEPPQAHAMATMRIPDPLAEIESAPLDPKVRANAERSARVLVGDIELYFPQKVQQGQTNRNLYGLLRDELDRSRASFIERYGADVEARHKIFYNTVLQQLCQGDAALLSTAPWAPKS